MRASNMVKDKMNKGIVKFLAISFAISWTIWFILAYLISINLMEYGKPVFMLLFVIAGNGPMLAALLVKGDNKIESQEVIKRAFKIKVSPVWYAYVFALPILIRVAGWLVNYMLTSRLALIIKSPFYMILIYMPVMTFFGGGLEEVGWRGFLFDKISSKVSIHLSTLITTLIWWIWHLPLWFINGTAQYGSDYFKFFISILGISLLLSTLYSRTKNIFLCALFHGFSNSLANAGVYSGALTTLTISAAVYILFTMSKKHNPIPIIPKI